MYRFLVMTLAAPLAAFGEVAGNVRRGGRERPGKSAVLGMAGAALGLRRDDAEAQAALAGGYGYAVRPERLGRPLLDYHTAQAAPARRGRSFATRREALASPGVETILTTREYRADVIHDLALWARPGARWGLEELQAALRRPRFVLYAGRKSCPLSLPLDPRIVEADGPAAAYDAYDAGMAPLVRDFRVRQALREPAHRAASYLAMDADPAHAPPPSNRPLRRERRRDVPRDRTRWSFSLREETIVPLGPADGPAGEP